MIRNHESVCRKGRRKAGASGWRPMGSGGFALHYDPSQGLKHAPIARMCWLRNKPPVGRMVLLFKDGRDSLVDGRSFDLVQSLPGRRHPPGHIGPQAVCRQDPFPAWGMKRTEGKLGEVEFWFPAREHDM